MTVKVIPVDFGNADEVGAVRLITPDAVEFLEANKITLTTGMCVRMSDDEITADGICEFRDGIWIAMLVRWIDELHPPAN